MGQLDICCVLLLTKKQDDFGGTHYDTLPEIALAFLAKLAQHAFTGCD